MAEKTEYTALLAASSISTTDNGKKLELQVLFEDGSGGTEVYAYEGKLLEFLSKQPGYPEMTTLEELKAHIESLESFTVYFQEDDNFTGFGLLPSGGSLAKTEVANMFGQAVEITSIDVLSSGGAVSFHLADGTISKRSFGSKADFKLIDRSKRIRFIKNELGIGKKRLEDEFGFTTYDDFDFSLLVGGKISYVKIEAKGDFKEWAQFKGDFQF